MGSADLWRYLAYLLPVIVVAFTRAARTWTRREGIVFVVIGALFTVYTQRPFTPVDLVVYFRDWFPYYQALNSVPLSGGVELWPTWGWRFLVVTLSLGLIASVHSSGR